MTIIIINHSYPIGGSYDKIQHVAIINQDLVHFYLGDISCKKHIWKLHLPHNTPKLYLSTWHNQVTKVKSQSDYKYVYYCGLP